MSAQSSQQVCLAANNKLISLDSESQLTQPPPTYVYVAISRLFFPHCLKMVNEGQFVTAGTKCSFDILKGGMGAPVS